MTTAGPQLPSYLSPLSRQKHCVGGVTSLLIASLSASTHSGMSLLTWDVISVSVDVLSV